MAVRRPDAPGPDGHDAPLDRAADTLRDADLPGWAGLQRRVVTTVRATVRPGTPVPADLPGGDPDDRLLVSDRVVVDALRRALAVVPGVEPSGARVRLGDDGTCTGVEIRCVASHGTDLAAATTRMRTLAAATLDDVLGPGPARTVDVTVQDVDPPAPPVTET